MSNQMQPWKPTELLLSGVETQLQRDIAREGKTEVLLSMLEVVLAVDIVIMNMVVNND